MFGKKTSIYMFLLIFLIPFLFAACENSTGTKNQPPDNTAVFPNTVGDKWFYAVYDSLSNSTDTLTVEIVGTTTGINDKSLKIWLFRSRTFNDSMFVYAGKDTVYFYEDSYANLVDHKLVFPLEVNNTWMNADQQFDSTVVKGIESVTVPSDTYTDAYRLERTWSSFNVYGYLVTWFVNNVGMVKMYLRVRGFDNIKETGELLSYTIQ